LESLDVSGLTAPASLAIMRMLAWSVSLEMASFEIFAVVIETPFLLRVTILSNEDTTTLIPEVELPISIE
jgi:hypothetical protein